MSEPFTFDVAYDTSFEQIEALRGRMIAFLSNERRDYVAVFDVMVLGKAVANFWVTGLTGAF
jgi:small-conductance mechanosensitive channel